MAHLKGQNVQIYRKTDSGYEVLAQASTSCDFSVTANTADGASKADADPMWDNPIFTYCDWSMSNESFIVSTAQLNTLIGLMIAGEAIEIIFDANTVGIKKTGKAVITSLDVDAPSDDYATLSLSLEGASALEDTTETVTAETASTAKIKGKTLMVSYSDGSVYKTISAATGHKLSISAQTSDTKTKDDNDLAISKEITGYSLTLSSDNLVSLSSNEYGGSAAGLLAKTLAGATLPIKFGYYDASGKDVVKYNGDDATVAATKGYGEPASGNLIVSGNFICTSWSMNNPNKEDSTMSAEFTAQGKPTFAA